ncbi:MAG: ABC transporter ATP-binding protein [Candidatus Thermoplasmatota archaeon]|nr:ABC transporter ATP-binding protein [Candidatus Thermoplasmatota archaeon]MCL5730802.1 ABC transporter ATP-binding protein [Candidatus Thermoplasmatota archaeon]
MPSFASHAVDVIDLVKSYDGRKNAVDGISFHVEKGEIYGFLGKNGAGKSTTIKVLTTLIPPTSGKAIIDGLDVVRNAIQIRRRIGVVQQEESFDFATVDRNFDIYAMLWEVPADVAARRKEELIELFNLGEVRKRRAFELSGGQKKRLQVAREFIHDMKVLFLDEPTVGMDPVMRRSVLKFVKQKATDEGISIMFTTQILEEADLICDRIAIIDNGKIVAEGTSSELKQKFGTMRKLTIGLSEIPDRKFIEEFPAVIRNVGDISHYSITGKEVLILGQNLGRKVKSIIDQISEMDVDIEHINLDTPTLDDVFLEVVGQ